MKIKIVFIFIILIIISSIICCADYERVNVPMPTMKDKPISVLDKATGWMFNDLGQWEKGENEIPGYSYDIFDNFTKLILSEITIDNQDFYILIRLYEENTLGEVNYYIFEKDEILKFAFKNKDSKLIEINLLYANLPMYYGSSDYDYLKKQIIEDVQKVRLKSSDNMPENYLNVSLNFNILYLKDKNIIRFIIFTTSDPSIDSYNSIPGGLETLKSDDIFNRCYYEVDFDAFNNFIPLIQE